MSIQFQFNSYYLYYLPTYKLYDTQRKYTNNILSTYLYILQWLAHIMGVNGAGNPIGFMGSLSDTFNLIYLNKGAGGVRVQQW